MSKPTPDTLPPPGDERRDALKRRTDELEAAAESASATIGAVDPSKLELDNEIAVEIVEHNALEVSGAQDNYRYAWIRAYTRDGKADMEPVMTKQGVRVRLRGSQTPIPAWEVVRGDHEPEAKENIDVHGYRRIGDCILMRCRREVYEALERDERRRAAEFAGTYEAKLDDAIAQAGLSGTMIRTSTAGMHPRDFARMRAEFARNGALAKFNDMLKSGTVPNLTPAQAVR